MRNVLIAIQNYHVALGGLILSLLVHIIFLILFRAYDILPLYYFNWFSVLLFSVLIIFTLKKSKFLLWTIVLLTIEVITHQILATSLLGLNYGFEYLFIPLAAYLILLFAGNFKAVLISFVTASAGMAVSFGSGFYMGPTYAMPISIKSFIHVLNLFSAFVITSIVAMIFSFISRKFQDRLLRESRTDNLTKIFNRKRATEFLLREFSRYQRGDAEFALSIGDIDDFKKINDTYGHQTGDTVLIKAAQTMRAILRQQDIIARWGGEEFLFILPDTSLDQGIQAVEKLRFALSDLFFEENGHTFQISMTFGIASARQENDPEKIIKLADDALYQGKESGKNRIVASEN